VYEAKTKPTGLSVAGYLAAIEDDARRKDCKELAALMKRATGHPPKMWGSAIVGFDSYHYRYASGHEGDASVVGFSSRKGDISVYLSCDDDEEESRKLLARLGKHKSGKACLYLRRLADVDLAVLEMLVERSVAATRQRYPRRT
jgi:hypothetical protein